MNTQDLRLIRRMSALMPLTDPIKKEKAQINKLEFSKLTTFITPRKIVKEIAFYYLLQNNVIDFVKLFTAEDIKDIYVNVHPEYKSLHDVSAPIIVIQLGSEVYNKQMITILNLLTESFINDPRTKALIFTYVGSVQEFKNKYKNAQERGLLNTGKTVSLTQTTTTKQSFDM